MMDLLSLDKLRSYDWASMDYAWLGWLIGLALAWGCAKSLWGRRWTLPLGPTEARPLVWVSFVAWLPRALRILGLALLLLALLRPQSVISSSESSVQSLDIYLALDVSGSMRADDLKPSRIRAAKETLKRFVDGLRGDRVGLVVFAGKAFTQCPLSLDHEVVKYFIDQVDVGTVQIDGTAMGDGLLLAVQRLIQEPKRGQVIVLATDGRSNAGQPPQVAAQVAAQAGIKLYTIGMGAKGGALLQVPNPYGGFSQVRMDEPDEPLMRSMAEATGGQYFRATDARSLDAVYARIASLERREIKVKNRREADEHFFPYLWLGALLLLAEALLRLRFRIVM
jgi:Ca-activated chloride channel family protein